MAFALQTAGILAVALKLTVASQLCYPCEDWVTTKSIHEVRSCDHVVSLNDIKKRIKNTINDLNKLIGSIENQLNLVHHTAYNRNLTQVPSAFPKVNKKIAFVHETYANFTHVQNLISSVVKSFTNKEEYRITLINVMCKLFQVNEKLQCKKIKKKKKWIDFRKSGACKINKLEREITNPKELQALDQAKSAVAILAETLKFWEKCVKNKRGRIVITKKCKKAKQNIKRRKSPNKYRRRKNRKRHRKFRKNTKLEKL